MSDPNATQPTYDAIAPKPQFKGHDGDPTTRRCKNCDMPVGEWAGKGACPGTKPAPDQYAAEYAIVEVFGHQRHIGRISEVERFGTKMLRVDEPTDVLHDANDMFAAGSTSYFLSGASIFRLTPCTIAVIRVHYARRAPAIGYLAPPLTIDRAAFMRDEDVSENLHTLDEVTEEGSEFDEVIEPAPGSGPEGHKLGLSHWKVEGGTTCQHCGTPVSDFDMVSCFTPAPNVSRETDGESNG